MAAYTFAYHMNGGCALENDPFWGDKNVRKRTALLILCCEETQE